MTHNPEPQFKGPAVLERARVVEEEKRYRSDWKYNDAPYPRVYHLVLHEEEDEGAFSAYCLELPGAVSEGDTEDEALSGLREAIEALVEEYQATGKPVPWQARELEDGDEIADAITLNG